MRRFHAALLSLTAVVAWCLQKTSCCSRETLLPYWNESFFLSPPCFQSPLYAIPIPRGHWSGDSLLFSQTKSIFCNIEFYAGIKKKKGKETPICGKKWSQHPCGVKWCIQHGWKGRSPVTVAAPPVEWELPPPVLWGQEEACPRPPASVRRPEMEEIARSYKMAIRGMTFKWQQCL